MTTLDYPTGEDGVEFQRPPPEIKAIIWLIFLALLIGLLL